VIKTIRLEKCKQPGEVIESKKLFSRRIKVLVCEMERLLLCGLLSILPIVSHSADPSDNLIPTYGSDLIPSYSDLDPVMSGIDMLRMAVPGNPGEDYPIYAEVPDTSFTCEGRVEGGYYADTEAECQPFHVCSADRDGGLARNSFLCPNGTLFNQENFVCEYWFNVDCSQAESFYGLNDNIGTVEQGDGLAGAASSPDGGYASPPSGAASSPTGGYASPSLDEYQPLRSGRRQGRLIADARSSSASAQVTRAKNSNSRFVNFPVNLKSPKINKNNKESKQQLRKDKTFNDKQVKSSKPDVKINVIQPSNERKKIRTRPVLSKVLGTQRKSKQTTRVKTQLNLPRKQFPTTNTTPITTASASKKRTGKSSRRRKPTKQKELRRGRTEVLTGYLPPVADSYTAGDATLAASSPDYDYEEAPLPTYTGASDTAGQSSYVAPVADTGYAAGSADTSYGAPADNNDNVDALADAVYEEEPLPTYSKASSETGGSYSAPVADSVQESSLPDSDFQDDILPAYNNGVYNNADSDGTSYTAPTDDSYGAPSDDSYGAPTDDSYGAPADQASDEYNVEDSDYEEDVLPQYNNGVYNPGSESSPSSGTSYTAPIPPSLADSDYEEDTLPQYNNGVYNNGGSVGGTSYTAPSQDSYGAPTANAAPATGYSVPSQPIPGSYQDPEADLLPEYFKSEITLGLNEVDDIPRVEPFLSDYGSPSADSYRVAGSSPVAAVVKTPDLTYGVPAAPTISLEDYNIQEVSDKGFTGLGGSSYGR